MAATDYSRKRPALLQSNSTPKRIVVATGSSARRTLEEKNPSSSSTEKSIQDKFIGMTLSECVNICH